MGQQAQQMAERGAGMFQFLEQLPTSAYYMLVFGSIVLSAVLQLSGRQRAGIFVGLWPPTFATLALVSKLLRPSQEARQMAS
jgi:hypothetical protein